MRDKRPTQADADQFYFTYIDKVPDGDVVEQLAKQMPKTRELLSGVDEKKASYRYEQQKWSVKQVLGHLADTERMFSFRALAFSRGDSQALPGMDQDAWIAGARFDELSLADIVADLTAIRAATCTLFKGLSDEQWQRRGSASGFEVQVGALAWIIAGHELHHRLVLEDRYGLGS